MEKTTNIQKTMKEQLSRKRVDFSSIAEHLQIDIAEKIEYIDQSQFALSSKRGKQIVSRTKREAVCDVYSIEFRKPDCIWFHFYKKNTNWYRIMYSSRLPRFKCDTVFIRMYIISVEVVKFLRYTRFIPNKVALHVAIQDEYRIIRADVFKKLTKIFNIREFHNKLKLRNNSIAYERKFWELEKVMMVTDGIPTRELTKLKACNMQLIENATPSRIASFANILVKQWLWKRRNIESIEIRTYQFDDSKSLRTSVETLLAGLPALKMFSDVPLELTILGADGERRKYPLRCSYLIDRGDETLMLTVWKTTVCASKYIIPADADHLVLTPTNDSSDVSSFFDDLHIFDEATVPSSSSSSSSDESEDSDASDDSEDEEISDDSGDEEES